MYNEISPVISSYLNGERTISQKGNKNNSHSFDQELPFDGSPDSPWLCVVSKRLRLSVSLKTDRDAGCMLPDVRGDFVVLVHVRRSKV